MKLFAWFSGVALFATTALMGNHVISQDEGDRGGQDMQSQIEAMVEMAAPSKFHDYLKPLAGSWNCSVKYWPAPGIGPYLSTGTLEKEWILGGRFLTEEYEGTIFNNMPYNVFSILGYDKVKKKYFNIHMDTLGTGFETSMGTRDAASKVITFTEEGGKSTLEIVSNDKNIARGFVKGPDGKEWMTLEITSTRK